MKVLIISNSDLHGGAAIASYRLHQSLKESNVPSIMMVRIKLSHDYTVIGPKGKFKKVTNKIRASIGSIINRLHTKEVRGFRSGNWLPSNWARIINKMDVDLVHIHWVGAETLSIEDLGRIKKPIVWTLHDMWSFCGTEHYVADNEENKWLNGYKNKHLLNLERIVWNRKNRSWGENINIVSPSNWLTECAQRSLLFKNNRHYTLPNILDINIFKPIEQKLCRKILNLSEEKKIILFGAFGGSGDLRKGYDLLTEAIQELAKTNKNSNDFECLIFGQSKPEEDIDLPVQVKWLGHIHDDTTLALVYNAANVMVVPSRQDNMPQTATEAQACGCPVVAFNCTGFPDIVKHKETGYLARPYDPSDLAAGISWVLNNTDNEKQLGINAAKTANEKWSAANLIPKYLKLYQDVVDSGKDK
ncbi:glycosyltransferase [Lelliottia wanjuensis]|uniref:glycosyltransferase n=1 Tax=Lelliottia wanjuensis TaxID=3050585 RepID=UPI00254E8E8B|nr:glycosyltransferase [Lelliottia sp. V104_15]MDK9606489.1 glycosyltransferase [Lelliottia sp. V104_15]